jgi:hypothetical protein
MLCSAVALRARLKFAFQSFLVARPALALSKNGSIKLRIAVILSPEICVSDLGVSFILLFSFIYVHAFKTTLMKVPGSRG